MYKIIQNSCLYGYNKTHQFLTHYKKIIKYCFYLLISNLILAYFSEKVLMINNYIIYAFYWMFLGILSTIGLGTGMYTGTFYLFPYLLEIKSQSKICNNLSFSMYDLKCTNNEIDAFDNYQLLLKSTPPLYLWCLGSCLGELPPYLLAKWAKDDYKKYLNGTILKKIKNNAFISILCLAIMPNFTFDMCGMASGFLDIDIYTFIIASFIGKGLIKGTVEAYTIMFVFENSIENIKETTYFTIVFDVIFYITMIGFLYSLLNKLSDNYILEYRTQ